MNVGTSMGQVTIDGTAISPAEARVLSDVLLVAALDAEARPLGTNEICGRVTTNTSDGVDTQKFCSLPTGHLEEHRYDPAPEPPPPEPPPPEPEPPPPEPEPDPEPEPEP